MTDTQWQLVFDASQKPFDWSFLSALPFVGLAVVLWFFRRNRYLRPRLWGGVFPFVFGGFAILWTTLAGVATVSEYIRVQ